MAYEYGFVDSGRAVRYWHFDCCVALFDSAQNKRDMRFARNFMRRRYCLIKSYVFAIIEIRRLYKKGVFY